MVCSIILLTYCACDVTDDVERPVKMAAAVRNVEWLVSQKGRTSYLWTNICLVSAARVRLHIQMFATGLATPVWILMVRILTVWVLTGNHLLFGPNWHLRLSETIFTMA